MDREVWWATVRGFAKSQTGLSDSHTHTHRQLEGFWDLVTIKPMEDVMEKKRCFWLLSPCTQKNLEGKSEMCERYAVLFAMELDSSFFSCLPTTFNNGFGIPFLYKTVQTHYIFKNVSLSMISSGTPYEIWVAHFVNAFIQEKTKGFYEFCMCGYTYVCIGINM